MCVLGFGAHFALRSRGVPTILEIDLPLSRALEPDRLSLAAKLLQEWTRVFVSKSNLVPQLDFTFIQRQSVPPGWINGHYHPLNINDPLHGGVARRTDKVVCPHCAAADATST